MISAPAAQISSTISEGWIIEVHGQKRPDYARTQAAMMAVIFTLLCFWIACGTEQRGSHFELAAAAGGGGADKLNNLESYGMESPSNQRKAEIEVEEIPQPKL